MDSLGYLLAHYGYLAVFLLLTVGIFGIPLPDEFLVAFIGYLIFQREMHFWPAALAVISGGIMGISVNYVVGRTIGTRLCNGLGYFFPEKRQRLNCVTDWLGNSGGPVLFLAYFLPGARHWATVGAGVVKLPSGVCAALCLSRRGPLVIDLHLLGLSVGPRRRLQPSEPRPLSSGYQCGDHPLGAPVVLFHQNQTPAAVVLPLKKQENHSLNR